MYKNLHTPVMLDEVVLYLNIKPGGNYLDCTFGGGGHSAAILNVDDTIVTAIDQDPHVNTVVDDFKLRYKERFTFYSGNFVSVIKSLDQKFDGIIFDLGISSMQLQENRGFSFKYDDMLDMRMSGEGISAYDFINNASCKQIADVLYQYGNEYYSRKIAKTIVCARHEAPIKTAKSLADLIARCVPKKRIHPATKSFQAIRIHINKELLMLQEALNEVSNIISSGGKLLIITFHSLESKIVKDYMKQNSSRSRQKSKYHTYGNDDCAKYTILTKKPIFPSASEISLNPQSRSAQLRIMVKK